MDQDLLALKDRFSAEDLFGNLVHSSPESRLDASTLRRHRLDNPILEFLGYTFLRFPEEISSSEVIRDWNANASMFSEVPLSKAAEKSFFDFTLFVLEGAYSATQGELEIGASDFRLYVKNLAAFASDQFVSDTFQDGQKGVVDAVSLALNTLPFEQIPEELRNLALCPMMLHNYPSLWDRCSEREIYGAVEYQISSAIRDSGLLEHAVNRIKDPTEFGFQLILNLVQYEIEEGRSPIGLLEHALDMCEWPICDSSLRSKFEGEIRVALAREYIQESEFEKTAWVVDGAFFFEGGEKSILCPEDQVVLKCLKGRALIELGEFGLARTVFFRASEISEHASVHDSVRNELYEWAIHGLIATILKTDFNGRGVYEVFHSSIEKVAPERKAHFRISVAESLFQAGFLRCLEDILMTQMYDEEPIGPDDEIRRCIMLDLTSRMTHNVIFEIPDTYLHRQRAVELYREYLTDKPAEILTWLLPDPRAVPEFTFDWCDQEETMTLIDEAIDWYMLHQQD